MINRIFGKYHSNLSLFILYLLLATIVTGPIASNKMIPPGDTTMHTSGIVQANLALRELQFPIRVSQEMNHGARYPFFQFYAPTIYTVGGILNFLIRNPYIVLKIIIWLSLMAGGVFMYRLAYFLTQSKEASLLGGAVYILAPYLIINVGSRGDMTEAIGQAILPIALYYSFQIFDNMTFRRFTVGAIAWFAVLTTHLITFAYSAFFVLLLFLIAAVRDRKIIGLIRAGAMIILAFLLASWFVGPIMMVADHLYIRHDMGNPYKYAWLTPFATLISPKAIAPMPLPGNNMLSNELYPSISLPVLFGVCIILYAFFEDRSFFKNKKMLGPLLIVFMLAFFITWSPFNFWKFIPDFFVILQFTYRMLTHVMWLGALLFSYALVWIFNHGMDRRHVMIGLFAILVANGSWMHSQRGTKENNVSVAKHFAAGIDDRNYIIDPDKMKDEAKTGYQPLENCKRKGKDLVCRITVENNRQVVVLPVLYYPDMLKISSKNDSSQKSSLDYFPVLHAERLMTGIDLAKGTYKVSARFVGLWWENWLSILTWLGLLVATIRHRRFRKRALPCPS